MKKLISLLALTLCLQGCIEPDYTGLQKSDTPFKKDALNTALLEQYAKMGISEQDLKDYELWLEAMVQGGIHSGLSLADGAIATGETSALAFIQSGAIDKIKQDPNQLKLLKVAEKLCIKTPISPEERAQAFFTFEQQVSGLQNGLVYVKYIEQLREKQVKLDSAISNVCSKLVLEINKTNQQSTVRTAIDTTVNTVSNTASNIITSPVGQEVKEAGTKLLNVLGI